MFRQFLATLLLISATGVFFLYIDPVYSRVQSHQEEASELKETLQRAGEFQTKRDELLGQYQAFRRSDLERLRTLLPDDIDRVRLIIDIETLAETHGLQLGAVSFEEATDPATLGATGGGSSEGQRTSPRARAAIRAEQSNEHSIGVLGFSFTLIGTYDALIAFVDDLERSLRLVDITGLSFTAPERSGLSRELLAAPERVRYTFAVTTQTYWLR